MTYTDGNFEEVVRAANELARQGNLVFQKWTCSFCGERITMDQPNVFHPAGLHSDCTVNSTGQTDIVAQGCNYMVMQAKSLKGHKVLKDLFDA